MSSGRQMRVRVRGILKGGGGASRKRNVGEHTIWEGWETPNLHLEKKKKTWGAAGPSPNQKEFLRKGAGESVQRGRKRERYREIRAVTGKKIGTSCSARCRKKSPGRKEKGKSSKKKKREKMEEKDNRPRGGKRRP